MILDYRAALRERTGVGEYTHELVRALLTRRRADESLGVSLFSSSWKDRFRPGAELAGAVPIDRRVPVSVLNFAWHRLQWPVVETIAGASYDVAHSLHPLLMPARDAAQVVTIHDLDFLLHPERTSREIRRDYPALARSHAHRADRLIVVSQFTAAQVQRHLGVAAERITVCSPGAPPWQPRQTTPPRSQGYVLFFGTLEPRKNVGALLDAYELLAARRSDLPELRLAGRATAAAAAWLERLERPPLNRLVRQVGYVEPNTRRALYEGARVLVQPSFEEGFGLPVLEAMTLGVPVVAANRGALPEVLGDAGLLVDPENVDQLAGAIERMIDDDAYAAAAGDKGVRRARQFTWAQTARNVLTAYEEAVANRAGTRGAA